MERWRDMNKKLKLKIHESLSAVIPITLIVLALGMTVVPMELSTLMLFLAGAALLILGMGFFTLGADMAMMPIGEQVGTQLTRSKRLWLIVAACFVIGVIITVAEPDLQVLARQTPRCRTACSSSRWPPAWGSSWWCRSCASCSDGTFRGAHRLLHCGIRSGGVRARRVPGRGIRFRRRDDGPPLQCRSSWRWVWA